MCVTRAPEQRAARLAEGVERPNEREVAERLLFESNTRGELVEAAIGPVALALGDDRLGLIFAEALHLLEADADVVAAAAALLQFVVIFVISMIQLKLLRPKWSY